MLQRSFLEDFEIKEENYGLKFKNSTYKVHLVQKKQVIIEGQATPEYYISVQIPHLENQDYQSIEQLRRLKYISVIQPLDFYEENNEFILIYLDYIKYRLTQQELEKIIGEGKIYRLLLQLALSFAEFEKRKFNWSLKQLEDIYFIDGLLYISLGDYNFQVAPSTSSECFLSFINQHFPNYFEEIKLQFQENKFLPLINYLFSKASGRENNNSNYEEVLKYILQVDSFQAIQNESQANCVVASFKTPPNLREIYPQLGEVAVYKSTTIRDQYKEQILKNIDKEIDLMEKNQSQYIAVCALYFRIDNQCFLLMKKYECTLQDALEIWQPTDEQLLNDVYMFTHRFAFALADLHRQRFIHRDLKPDNLFLNKKGLSNCIVYIADLDRSKILISENNVLLTTFNRQNHQKYDPPEENQTLKYDVFQFGLIVLQVANKGVYVGDANGPRLMDIIQTGSFDFYYSPQAINNKLSQYKYDKKFIDLIIKCLSKDPLNRPDAEEIKIISQEILPSNNVQKSLPPQKVESKEQEKTKIETKEPAKKQEENKTTQQQKDTVVNQMQTLDQQRINSNIQEINLKEKILKLQEILKESYEDEETE